MMRTETGNVPPEMRSLCRWVGRDEAVAASLGLGPKTPLQLWRAAPASVSDPSTWGSWEDAEDAVLRGVYSQAGFVFADDGLVGVDIDGGAAFGSDGMLSDGAMAAISAFGSYAELSQGGRGIHIVCRGSLPFDGAADGSGWEIYKAGRYFVMTGRVLCGMRAVADAQGAIDALVTERFAARGTAAAARKGRIWEPEWTAGERWWRVRYPTVGEGGRHLAMVSYAGQAASQGAAPETVLAAALEANRAYMDPPLPEAEVRSIARSTRWR